MNDRRFAVRVSAPAFLLPAVAVWIAGCSMPAFHAEPGSFAGAKAVLESNCVRCHGPAQNAQQPIFRDSDELRQMVGLGNWIIPNHPESSRFLRVLTMTDDPAAATASAGHSVSRAQIEALRDWITVGAPIPAAKVVEFSAHSVLPHL